MRKAYYLPGRHYEKKRHAPVSLDIQRLLYGKDPPEVAQPIQRRQKGVIEGMPDDADIQAHWSLVKRAWEVFGPESLPEQLAFAGDTKALAWARTCKFLLDNNHNPCQVGRWRLACETLWDVHVLEREPYRTWAKELLDSDMTTILQKLQANGKALQYTSPYPRLWPDSIERNTASLD